MPHLDRTGPEGEGPATGRGLGKCRKGKKNDLDKLGKGQGKRRQSGGGKGEGRRLKSGRQFDNEGEQPEIDCNDERE